MNHIIEITERPIGETLFQTVNSRDVHKYVESKQQYADWIKSRLSDIGAVDGVDFTFHNFMNGKAKVTDYIVTLDIAKHIAMMERNEKGREIRQYFIDAEKNLMQIKDAYIQRGSLKVNRDNITATIRKARRLKLQQTDDHVNPSDPLVREVMYHAYGGKCFYTGKKLDPNHFHIDHIHPKAHGGTDSVNNLVLCDPEYNLSKGDLYDYAMIRHYQEINEHYCQIFGHIYNDRIIVENVSQFGYELLNNAAMVKLLMDLIGEKVMRKIMSEIMGVSDIEMYELSEVKQFYKDAMIIGQGDDKMEVLADVYRHYEKWCRNRGTVPHKSDKFKEETRKILRVENRRLPDQKRGYRQYAIGCSIVGGAL